LYRAPHATNKFTEQIKKLQRNGTVDHEISVCWVPRRTLVSNKILEDEGMLGDLNVSELPLYFLPLEDDLFSVEAESAFSDLYLVDLPCTMTGMSS
jgi:vacuolar protein sorting-associated protein 33A